MTRRGLHDDELWGDFVRVYLVLLVAAAAVGLFFLGWVWFLSAGLW